MQAALRHDKLVIQSSWRLDSAADLGLHGRTQRVCSQRRPASSNRLQRQRGGSVHAGNSIGGTREGAPAFSTAGNRQSSSSICSSGGLALLHGMRD
ncbi:hypothetical protein AMECASPLE_037864 [Ameca splendens]|uniref:Uncharacterized protein n=1 Tax=Ameca splendens TaxID=208324 RepID=A0ABV0XL27_9TELE